MQYLCGRSRKSLFTMSNPSSFGAFVPHAKPLHVRTFHRQCHVTVTSSNDPHTIQTQVTGGPFPYVAAALSTAQQQQDSSSSSLLKCSIGGVDSPARWISSTEVTCLTPALPPVAEIQTVRMSALAYAPQVVELQLSAAAPANEVHTIATSSAAVRELSLIHI